MTFEWKNVKEVLSQRYVCGYCSNRVASKDGWTGNYGSSGDQALVLICPDCRKPTFLDRRSGKQKQVPSPLLGEKVQHLPNMVNSLYEEARACTSVNAFIAASMSCRTILMYVAVDLGAKKENLSFAKAVNYLESEGHITARAKEWVDYIRQVGNRANHEITPVSPEVGKRILQFTEALLKMVYELPGQLPSEEVQAEEVKVEADQQDGEPP